MLHEGLLLRLEDAGISGNLRLWFRSNLSNRKQRVVLPGAEPNWNYVRTGVPQGTLLEPLLFLVLIKDIVNVIGSNICLSADETSLFTVTENSNTAAELLNLDKVMKWGKMVC